MRRKLRNRDVPLDVALENLKGFVMKMNGFDSSRVEQDDDSVRQIAKPTMNRNDTLGDAIGGCKRGIQRLELFP